MPVVNQALIECGVKNISSVVTTFDSGGDTGRMRTDERGRILAYSDYWRSLMSLWTNGKQKEVWWNMLRYRDGRDRNFGNIFFQFMAERQGSLLKVADLFCELTKAEINGRVVPVSVEPAEVCFETISGKRYCGEHKLDELRMSSDMVCRIWTSRPVKANKEAMRAVENAEVIIICPGSMFGSVLINFLPEGIAKSYQRSQAKKILVTNIMSVRNENHGFDQNDYLKTFGRYLGKDCFDLVIMADLDCLNKSDLKKAKMFYRMERSYPIKSAKTEKVKTMMADVALIETENYRLRHSVQKMSQLFGKILI